MSITYTLLPGMHGSSHLFTPLVEALGEVKIELVSYPNHIPQSYKSLEEWLSNSLDWTIPRSIIAESFSGPLALTLTDKFPESVKALTLAASFCAPPTNPNLALLPLRPLFMIRPPKLAIQQFLTGPNISESQLRDIQKVIANVPSKTISQRIRSVLELDQSTFPKLLDTPIQILNAQDDAIIAWDIQNQLCIHYPHATTHWLDAPHLMLQLLPAECANLIKEFTTQHCYA
jgi:pimeloyl-[acyl-carrier protein] methyl ester esterase